MSEIGSLEYAHARLCARYGERPDEPAWRRIEHVRDFPAMLDAARTSALRDWTAGIASVSTPHEIDARLRELWRVRVDEVASWMPAAWQPATRWCAVAVDLPMLAHLARGGAAMPWMRDDAMLREMCEGEVAGPGSAPRGAHAPLLSAWAEPDRLGVAWRAEYWRRVPRAGRGEASLLDEFARALKLHLRAFNDVSLRDGWPLRRALQARLAALFRRAVLDPAAAFIFLALLALDLERLRGELLRRAAFVGASMTADAAP